ncbi:hypothetical protein CDL15_Pgr000792 [Punica granatum]|uniref:Uncharacterized protein n=1 Tax=Punica granatum TaxID=22663 RepID=A0A218W4W2_PUNGR|nr:hypothetical protein CDL15_Pgr000792 [Punica granatum]PKI39086.1 hypothetical protein CRG98_040510 [Punica granatum]
MGLKHSSRVFDNIDKINRLQSRYVESSGEIETLKARKREMKEKLRKARLDYDAIKGMNLSKSERTLRKADKNTTIDGLEQILERTRGEIQRLERDKDRAFERRERIKERTVRRMSFEGSTGSDYSKESGRSVLVMSKVGDVEAVAKMMELMRAGPSLSSKVGSLPQRDDYESVNAPAMMVDSKMKVKVMSEDPVMEKTVINTGKKRVASVKLK